MSKLYIFGIGGTGARVLKSLTFLLAAGAKCEADTIVPIIIDPDGANGDVSKTVDILRYYQDIRKELSFHNESKNEFFKTEIDSLNSNFRLNIQNSNKKFNEFIDYPGLDKKNKALISLLFSEKNLKADMEVGFKGNPNMGSVVLNQFNQSEDFKDFASSFSDGDRIFIISSIFGGTGASGFPLLLKNIRSASPDLNNHALLQNAPIGAISVLPYFGVKRDNNSDIEKSTFISKTKAALRYYEKGVNDAVNCMYYIGDNVVKDYENNEGSVAQKNDAHFIELASALSILNFANQKQIAGNVVKEFGLGNNSESLHFNDLADVTKHNILKPLSQYYFFHLYLKNKLDQNLKAVFADRIKINTAFVHSAFMQKLKRFNGLYWEWLQQMNNNKRSFSPFTLQQNNENIFNSLKDHIPHNGFLEKTKNYERFTAFLNKNSKSINNSEKVENRFMALFYEVTENLMQDKYKI